MFGLTVSIYLQAIRTRDFSPWRRAETLFLGGGDQTPSDFEANRRLWLTTIAAIDPSKRALEIKDRQVRSCGDTVHLALAIKGTPSPGASLQMCWHERHQVWRPCQALTIAGAGSIVKP